MRKLITLLSAAAFVIGSAGITASAADQQRDRKRDGSCQTCPYRDQCPQAKNQPNPKDCPQQQAQEKQQSKDGSGAGDQKRDRKRDGSCQK